MTTLYPWGYQRALVTEERLWELARFDLVDPETGERFRAWLRSKGGKTGIGGAVRFVQPDKAGFAPPGQSFHELQTWSDGGKNFAALDLVVVNGSNIHRSPTWSEVPKQGSGHSDISNYGVHANVDGEPWHLQAIEVDGWQTWVNAGRKRPNSNFVIIGQNPPPAPVPDQVHYSPGQRTVRLTNPWMTGIDIAYLQQTLNRQSLSMTADGAYGPQTEGCVKTVQRWNNLEEDGVVGPKTWAVVIAYNSPVPPPINVYEPGARVLKLASPTMRGTDVLWLQNVLKNQGLSVSADSYYGSATVNRVKTFQGWNNLEQDGVVGPKSWAVLKQY